MQKEQGYTLNIVLFLVTIVTTTLAGSLMSAQEPTFSVSFLLNGLPFSVAIMSILGIHELGHFFASKYHNVDATLPYFIPFPTIIGTFGAFIKMKSPISDRNALFDIGFSGPACGFLVAVPLLFLGVSMSEVKTIAEASEAGLHLGNSLLVKFVVSTVWGHIPEGKELVFHPIAFAAWIGLWVTSINLIPIGQLDGGHISYAVFGRKHKIISWAAFIVVVLLGYFWLGWLFWGFVVFFILKLEHPPPVYNYLPLDPFRKKLSIAAGIIFVITFIPVPFSIKALGGG